MPLPSSEKISLSRGESLAPGMGSIIHGACPQTRHPRRNKLSTASSKVPTSQTPSKRTQTCGGAAVSTASTQILVAAACTR